MIGFRHGLLILLLAGVYMEYLLPKQFPFLALTVFVLFYAFGDHVWKIREGFSYGMINSLMMEKPGIDDRRDYSYGSIEDTRLSEEQIEKISDEVELKKTKVWTQEEIDAERKEKTKEA